MKTTTKTNKTKKKPKLFGTDGIRHQVGEFPLDDLSIIKLGRAFGSQLPEEGAKILIGRDTRGSGVHIEHLITSGIITTSENSEILSCNVIPSPGLSYITEHGSFDYGIMITASHNPYSDNGIKFFGPDGEKISEQMEEAIEAFFHSDNLPEDYDGPSAQYSTDCAEVYDSYRNFLFSHASGLDMKVNGRPFKLIVDCANGACFELAPTVFKEAGFDTVIINAKPDGRNINKGCGSTHIDDLCDRVLTEKADLGIAFDGDGDRVLFVDSLGRSLSGDYTLLILAQYFLEAQSDAYDFNKIVVGTVMGNLGLEKALEKLDIRYVRTQVGDKYVSREMNLRKAILGGEQSGHTILKAFQKTGDGILTALYFLKAISFLGISSNEIFNRLTMYPQVTVDIKIAKKRELSTWDNLNKLIREFEEEHGSNSRLVIRYSGTEPKIRLMMESEHRDIIYENIDKFEDLIRAAIGSK